MDENKNSVSSSSEEIARGLMIAGVIIILLIIGNITGLLGGKSEEPTAAVQNQVQQNVGQVQTPQQNIPQAPVQQAPVQQDTTAAQQETTAAPHQTPPANSSTMSTAEIIELFNKSANTVKTDATKVVKNYEKRKHNEDQLIVPDALKGMAADILNENFKDDTVPIEYLTREEIVDKYQVPGVEWASQLTEAEVASATCVDNGTEWEITITLHPTENPEPGVGVAKAFDTITSSEVMEKAPSFVTGFSTNYTNCTVKCKIDKASGRTTWSNYDSTVVLAVTLSVLGKNLDAQVSMSFEKDYTITY